MKKKAKKKAATKRKTGRKSKKDQMQADIATLAEILAVAMLEDGEKDESVAEVVEGWRERLAVIRGRWREIEA